jgi:hypothetical protein
MYVSTLDGLWTYSNCTVHAIRNFLGRDANEFYDLYTQLCKNHTLTFFLDVLRQIMTSEGLEGHLIVTPAYKFSEYILRQANIAHIFVIKGQHIYNITRTHILDSTYQRVKQVEGLKTIIEELRDANLAILYICHPAALSKI